MTNFGWSYPAGCTGTPYDEGDDTCCAYCGIELPDEDPGIPNPLGGPPLDSIWQDGFCSCRCFLAAGQIHSHALPMPVVRGLARREPDYSVESFCNHIGCGKTLRENLRAIYKHNLEHVWLILMDGRTAYYHSRNILDTLTGKEIVRAVGAGCIAWDDSDWKTEHVIELRDEVRNDHANHWVAVDAVRALCNEDYDDYIAERDAEDADAAWPETLVTLVPEHGEPATAPLSHWLDRWRNHEDAVSELRRAAGRGRQGSWYTPVGLMFCRPATPDEKAAWAAS